MKALLFDTHAVVWRLEQSPEMPARLHNLISEFETNGLLLDSTMSLIEIAYLIDRGRVSPTFLEEVVAAIANEQTALQLVDIDLKIALHIPRVPKEIVPELPDRVLAATALALGVPLVTRDRKIRAFGAIETIW